MGYGLPRATLKLLARRGDPFAQLLIDTSQPKRVYHLVEQMRQRGRISAVVGNGWVTADAQIVRDVLRDGRFRTVKRGTGHRFAPFSGCSQKPILAC
jgi:protein-L-isoaspartate O-methyltransferase